MLKRIGDSFNQLGDSYLHRVALAARIQAKIKEELGEEVKVTFTGSVVRVHCQNPEQAFVLGVKMMKLKKITHALAGRAVRVTVRTNLN